ncbi:zinc-binding dehydrogenase [Streptomyces sp. NPDC006463]|uniref:zinc-binding dehydrogenase n=1 Tax=Streptomyces sp. NPDC006463 TaxID=3364746 RepID=UPI0036A45BA7
MNTARYGSHRKASAEPERAPHSWPATPNSPSASGRWTTLTFTASRAVRIVEVSADRIGEIDTDGWIRPVRRPGHAHPRPAPASTSTGLVTLRVDRTMPFAEAAAAHDALASRGRRGRIVLVP